MTYAEYSKREQLARQIAELAYDYGVDEQRNLTVLTSLMFAQLSIVAPKYYDENDEEYEEGDNDGYDENDQKEIESMMTEEDNFPYPREVRDELVRDMIREARSQKRALQKATAKLERILARA